MSQSQQICVIMNFLISPRHAAEDQEVRLILVNIWPVGLARFLWQVQNTHVTFIKRNHRGRSLKPFPCCVVWILNVFNDAIVIVWVV